MITASPQAPARREGRDLIVGGCVAVRVLGTPTDVALVQRQLGVLTTEPVGDAALTVRFTDALDIPSGALLAGEDVAFTREHAYLLRGPSKVRRRTRIALPDVTKQGEILCERGLSAVPFLLPIVNTAMAREAVLALHASAFAHDGLGVVVTGWAKGGKTETLLAFAQRGARYIADEWTYIWPGGDISGVPEPVRLWAWQLRQLPRHTHAVDALTVARTAALDAAGRRLQRLGRRGSAGRLAAKAGAAIARQANVRIPVTKLFRGAVETNGCALHGVVLASGHTSHAVEVRRVDPAEVVARMTHAQRAERAGLLGLYAAHRFAFPQTRNALLEGVGEVERGLMAVAFKDVPAFELRHPHPVNLSRLHDALAPALAAVT